MCWRIVTSDLPVFDPIDKKFLLQNTIKVGSVLLTSTKTIKVTEYENDTSVLEFPNHVFNVCSIDIIDKNSRTQVISHNTSTRKKMKKKSVSNPKLAPLPG